MAVVGVPDARLSSHCFESRTFIYFFSLSLLRNLALLLSWKFHSRQIFLTQLVYETIGQLGFVGGGRVGGSDRGGDERRVGD